MELSVYDRNMTPIGVIDEINSLIWSRRYWSAGEFKLLVPFTTRHVRWLKKTNIIMKRGGDEAAEIRFVDITKNSQGHEEIEVQGKFLTGWIGKRIVRNQISTTDTTQNIMYRIVRENVISPVVASRRIAALRFYSGDLNTGSGRIEYVSEAFINALLAVEDAAKAAKLGFRMITDVRARLHYFSVYEGRNLTADQTVNPPCVFSQEFDNIVEQEYTNSIENLKSTAYVGGEEEPAQGSEEETKPTYGRLVAEVGGTAADLDRDEIFINATDISRVFKDDADVEHIRSVAELMALLSARGGAELEYHAETLNFASKINTHANLKYKEDYDLGDRVTCINKSWVIKINVRITEIVETYSKDGPDELEITFGESLPALLDQIRTLTKSG